MIFDDVLTAKLEAVAHLLGKGWIINKFKTDLHRVSFSNQNMIGARITCTLKQNRLNIYSYANSRNARHSETVATMTASPDRKIASLAAEIKKRLMDGLPEAIARCNQCEENEKANRTEKTLIQETIRRMVPTATKGYCHSVVMNFKTATASGTLKEPYSSGYRLDLSDLKIETVFKIIALLNQPEDGAQL